MKKIKVLYIISSAEMGGSQQSLLMLVKNMSRDGFERVIVSSEKGFLTDELVKLGERVIIIREKSRFGLLSLAKFVCILKKEKVDVIHLYASRVKAIVAKLTCNIPVVERINMARDRRIFCPSYFRLIDNFMLRFVDRIITVSKFLENSLVERGISRSKIITVYNGICYEKFGDYSERDTMKKGFNIAETDFVIGTVCRLVKGKGIEYLFRAVAVILKSYPSAKLLVVGDGPMKKVLERLVIELNLDGKVVFTGVRKDVPKLFSIMDVFVLPSLYEALPNVVLEAHAAGVPVVATNVGGSPEVIIDNKTGLLVEPGSVEQLADAISYLLDNREKAGNMAKLAKERIRKKFMVEDMVKKTERVYIGLCRF